MVKRRKNKDYPTSLFWKDIEQTQREMEKFLEEWLKIKKEIRKKRRIPI